MVHTGSVLDLFPDSDVIHMHGNVGTTALLFDNPHYRRHFMALGLRPEDAYRCAMEFLFTPTAAVLEHFKQEFDIMAGDKFKIAIQMRLGDSFLTGKAAPGLRHTNQKHASAELRNVQHFFDCAEQLEKTYKTDDQDCVWFVVSDSLEIRRQASEAYAPKVMTRVTQPGHVIAKQEHSQTKAMIEAAGKHWLLAMTDYQNISEVGGFGKTGALRKHSWHTIYRLPVDRIPEAGEFVCDGLITHLSTKHTFCRILILTENAQKSIFLLQMTAQIPLAPTHTPPTPPSGPQWTRACDQCVMSPPLKLHGTRTAAS